MSSRAWTYGFVGLALMMLAGGCGSAAKHATAPSTTRVSAATATTLPGVQTSGPRTVLSPVGINVRAEATKSAPVLGTAERGSVLTVLGHTAANGGWYEVKGASHTGWVSGESGAHRRRRAPPLHLKHLRRLVSADLDPQAIPVERRRSSLLPAAPTRSSPPPPPRRRRRNWLGIEPATAKPAAGP